MKRFLNILLIVALIIVPIIAILLSIFAFNVTDIGSFIGGIVSYIGTVILGAVSLSQNIRLHKLERSSKKTRIQFDGTLTYKVSSVADDFVENSIQAPSNYFLISDNKDFKGENLITLRFPFKIDGYSLKYAILDGVIVNEEEHNEQQLFINRDVRTEVVYSVKDKTFQIELAIIAAEFKKIQQLIKSNDLIISLYYKLISSADVMTLFITKFNLGNFLESQIGEDKYEMNNISYWEDNDV